jgi:hypothetical protein
MFEKILNKIGLFTASQVESKVSKAKENKDDELATQLFDRGGFATIQLNPKAGHLPRMKFIDHSDAVSIPESKRGVFGFF